MKFHFPQKELLLCAVVLLFACACQSDRPSNGMNLVVIWIDTLRADHMGCYGYYRATSPNIDRFAEEATLFEKAISQSPWTLPSTASLLTGLYPTRHQAINKIAKLPDHRETLAELLQASGYKTCAIVSHSLGPSRFNVTQGFKDLDESQIGPPEYVSSPGITNLAIEWLKKNKEHPFFIFLHYFDPHFPYIEHPEHTFRESYDGWIDQAKGIRHLLANRNRFGPGDVAYLRDCYDSEISFTDFHVGRVLDSLKQLGLNSSSLVVVSSDHGEEFMDHGTLGHTKTLYEDLLHVPLIIRNPRMPAMPRRVSLQVELIDIMPALLDMLEIDYGKVEMDGSSFLAMLQGNETEEEPAFSEVSYRFISSPAQFEKMHNLPNLRAVREGKWKLIHNATLDRYEFYNLASDPGEKANRYNGPRKKRIKRLKQLLEEWTVRQKEMARKENPVPHTVKSRDKETEDRLRALGYVY